MSPKSPTSNEEDFKVGLRLPLSSAPYQMPCVGVRCPDTYTGAACEGKLSAPGACVREGWNATAV